MTYEFIFFENIGRVAVITLNRPHTLNALCEGLIKDLGDALKRCEENPETHCIVLMGSEKAFAAGADIKEIQSKTYMNAYLEDFITKGWETVSACRKPIIAAVSGYALGGGCEIAMMCDIIIASDTALFGQPEVTIGTLPGAGGTQRLTRAVGKSKAMDLCLTGRLMNASEAEQAGLVSRVVPADQLKEEVLAVAQKIGSYSLPIVMMIKESIRRAFETPLAEGLLFERRLFQSTFSLEDQKEGMAAFIDKRSPAFKDK
ncbi:MAG: enoyl-CoA hydratase [Alphaproteobacteria bacterium]|jgi:enoyl-CoA hydratase|nr:enoyl-CoA hydratase [Alphaproteobacteria bacterium]MBP7729919.1 enoyl-CoA hydratase [Alphaproteobacteria bacterium]